MFIKKIVFMAGILGIALLTATFTLAQENKSVKEMDLSGPRLGITIMPDSLRDKVKQDRNIVINSTVTQFGFQSEKRFLLQNNDLMFMTELVLLVGGIEQNLMLPSFTGIVGVRTKDGVEFGVGPYLSAGGTALVYAGGVTFQYGGMNVPVNVAVVPFKDGTSVNLLTGFNW